MPVDFPEMIKSNEEEEANSKAWSKAVKVINSEESTDQEKEAAAQEWSDFVGEEVTVKEIAGDYELEGDILDYCL